MSPSVLEAPVNLNAIAPLPSDGMDEEKEDVVLVEVDTSATSKKPVLYASTQPSFAFTVKNKDDFFWVMAGASATINKPVYGKGDKKNGPLELTSTRYTVKTRLVNFSATFVSERLVQRRTSC